MSVLIAVLSFFLCHKQEWFGELKSDYGNLAIGIFLFVCFLVPFLVFELICNKVSANKQEQSRRFNEFEMRKKKAVEIFETFNRLTDWQKKFLITNILQGKSQIKEYEIGGYKAVWEYDINALMGKRIINELSFGNYEINPAYYDYIEKYYNPKDETLSLPDINEIKKEVL